MTRTQFLIGKFIYYDSGGGTDSQSSSNQASSLEFGNPIGTIISFMGNTPPDGYLFCDGTVYNIADYQDLADFIKNQFGSYNNFGGDGTTTFAVPDLRGEFLRGTGKSNYSYTNGGSAVGTHQNATRHKWVASDSSAIGATQVDGLYDADWTIRQGNWNYARSGTVNGSNWVSHYTSRPTNTSVMYCIKYTELKRVTKDNDYIDLNEIGHIAWEMYLKRGYLKLDGSELQNASTDYEELLKFAQDYELITTTTTDKSKFKYNELTDVLTLPDFMNKTLWSGNTIEEKEAGLPNITGTFGAWSNKGATNLESGVFYRNAVNNNAYTMYSSQYEQLFQITLNASRSSSIYGNSTTVQPPAIQLIPQIKYKNS